MPAPSEVLGPAALAEFRDDLPVDRLRALLAAFGDDGATTSLRATVGGSLDLADPSHRLALLAWLRAWGCRHLRDSDTSRSSAALARWWATWAVMLPPHRASLTALRPERLAGSADAYASLSSLRAASRASAAGDIAVTFGQTAAAKALFALRPRTFPPWDQLIRNAFGRNGSDGARYAGYLIQTADALRGCAARFGVRVDRLPTVLGRPDSTPAKVIDEYLWLRLTRARR